MDRLNKSTSANCADKRKKQRSRLRLWWGFLLLVAHTMAWAQDYPEYPANVSSLPIWEKQSSGDFKIEGVIDISSPIYVNGELKLYPVATSNNPTPTIRRIFDNTNLQYAVFVLDGTDKLSIVGNENNQLTFFGGTGNIINPIPTDERNMGGAVQCKGNAEVRLKYVNLARFAVKTEGGLGDAVIALNEASSNGKCYLDHTTFSNCYAGQWDLTKTDDTSWGRIFSLRAGTWKVIMDYVDIHDCIVHERRNSNHSGIYGMGGIIRSQGNVGGSLLMRNCTIKDNQYRDLYKDGATAVSYYSTRYSEVAQQPLSGQGGAINWRSGAFASDQETQVTISGCNFHDNFAMLGGAIATCATIEMNNTKIYGNKAEEGGGVYFWTYNADQDAYDGRGFTAEFNSNTLIYENTATVCGGGIAIRIDASDDVGFSADGTSRDVEFKVNLMAAEGHSQQISDNHAPKGAGVAIIDRAPKNHKNTREKLMDNNSNNPAYNRWSGEYTRTISIEGSEIFDNTTSSDHFSLGQNDKVAGGGIYIDKTSEDAPFPADYTVSIDGAGNSGGGGGSLTVNVKHGKIYGNNAINGTREGLGGGLYIANPMKNDFPSSELTVNIGNDTPQLHINKNQAYTHGGGFYILGGNVNITRGSNQTLQIGLNPNDNNNVYRGGNKALNGNGGGFCVLGGVVTVNGGKIEYNTAGTGGGGLYVSVPNNESITTIQGNASISYNTANNGNGGGVCLDKGRINIYGSDISNNKATKGNGGGLYIEEGDILVWPNEMLVHPNAPVFSQCEATKTTVLNNKAGGNGGGLNTHVGRFDVRFAQIKNNTAGYNYSSVGTTGGNGGGLFCDGTEHDNGYTVRLLHCDLEENKAHGNVLVGDGITGRGGGVYLKHGSIFAEHCDIIKNEADINGGGLDNHSGELRVYGTYIDENKAHEGRGGGLYTEEGNIVVGPCDTYGYPASKASRIILNKAKINGGGINNHKGDITIHGDLINQNEAEEGDGGGVYIKEGNILMYGGQINNNKADQGKGGGVYGGSGKFNIKERKANPIVEILEVEDIMATKFKVHYHLVDRGLAPITVAGDAPDYTYSVPNPDNLTHGIAYSTIDPSTTAWTSASDSTVITYTAGTHEYVLSEGCVRVPSGRKLSANTTYYVIAWAKYTISEGSNAGNYYDASPVVEIKTIGSIAPVVATDRVSDISATSATVSGELLYEGDGSGTVTKGIRYRTGENEWTSVLSYSTVDEFSVNLAGLDPNTDYQAQAYATKGENTGYGEIITFTTAATGSKAPQGPRSVYPAVEENPFFMELTPLQQAMLANTPEGDTTAAPASRAITDRDDPAPKAPENIPQINGNTARYGGGICIDKQSARLVFSGTKDDVSAERKKGQINLNFASEAGGGIYIGYQTEGENIGPAMMQMMGKCEVNYNHVPASKQGGGIYLDGRLYVGDQASDGDKVHGLKVDRNFSSDIDQDTWVTYAWNETYTPANSKLNNVFLPRSEYEYPEHENSNAHDNKISVITLLSDISGYEDKDGEDGFDPDEDEPYSCIGFSVLKGFCPVIATAEEFGGSYANVSSPDVSSPNPMENWMYKLMLMSGVGEDNTAEKLTGAIFEDSESYVAVHTRHNVAPFLGKFIYLWGCWTHPIVKTDPETKQPMKGSSNSANPSSDPNWQGHYVITNPGENKKDGTGAPLVWEIYSPEGLAWFTSYVNGLNAFDEATGNNDDDNDHHAWKVNKNPKAIAKIMNDLDMSAYLWVPIGSVQKFQNTIGNNNNGSNNGSLFNDSEETVTGYTEGEHKYCGKFDGQGHIIKGLQGLYLTGIKKFGLFGYLTEGAEVKNVFVDKGLFMSDNAEVEYAAGGIAGEMDGGTLTNSEARMNFNSTYSAANTTVGGLVGNMNKGHIHSCMAMPSFTTSTTTTGQYVGGLVGKMAAGTTLKNSFSNVKFLTKPNYKVGGIAGGNEGTIENVYVRYNNEDNKPDLYLDNPDNDKDDTFYWISANNNVQGGISYCFTPAEFTGRGAVKWVYTGPDGTAATKRRTYKPVSLSDGKYGFAHKDQEVEAYGGDNNEYIPTTTGLSYKDNKVQFNGLVDALNNWVADNSGHTPWTRTMASTINEDYPVLMFNDFNVVGTEDGIYMKYDDNVNDMWKKPNYKSKDIAERTGKDFQGLTSYNNPKAAMYLYNTNPTAINVSRNEAVRLYIHENVGITQTDGAELHARVGVTFDNSDGTIANGGAPYDWHMFSSALTSASMGLKYHTNEEDYPGVDNYYIRNNFNDLSTNGIEHDYYVKRINMDPPKTTWFKGNVCVDSVGYFPTNTPYGTWREDQLAGENGSFDFYCFHEKSRHWINFKREGTTEFMDHWHEDIDGSGKHQNLWYKNESTFQVGKGYMMGVSAVSMLMADGILNNGPKTNDVATTGKLYSAEELTNSDYGFNPSGYSEELRGTNLVGNPFQSYLNFDLFAFGADSEHPSPNKDKIDGYSYHIFDADKGGYKSYTAGSSYNPVQATCYIHPHQGFFVKTAERSTTLTFDNTMRSTTGNTESYFRNKLNYPLVNLFCYDAEGHYDVTTVEMNRPELGGGSKLKDMRNGNSLIYARMENEDYQTLFAPTGTSTVPVRFEPSQDGVYTMRWGTLHGDFHYLHLVDNMSGADVDMLRSEEYRFEATTSDYISRFKLVFEVTDVEENPIEAEATTFAFCMGDEIIVNGAGYLEVFDVQGRRLSAKRLVDAQSSVSLPNVAAGIYFLRLSDDKQVRTQKMVINY